MAEKKASLGNSNSIAATLQLIMSKAALNKNQQQNSDAKPKPKEKAKASAKEFKTKAEKIEHMAKKKQQRLNLIYMAKIANTAKQFDDLLTCARRTIRILRSDFRQQDMTVNEKVQVSAAFKNTLMCKRR